MNKRSPMLLRFCSDIFCTHSLVLPGIEEHGNDDGHERVFLCFWQLHGLTGEES